MDLWEDPHVLASLRFSLYGLFLSLLGAVAGCLIAKTGMVFQFISEANFRLTVAIGVMVGIVTAICFFAYEHWVIYRGRIATDTVVPADNR
jgi:uncharacterized membrane protein